MWLRKHTVPVVTRQVAKIREVYTVFGEKEVVIKLCNTCFTHQPLVNFYLRTDGTPRNQCCTCWDKFNGKSRQDYIGESFSLDEFCF